mgnify:CR=1|jgi:hypothetical protein
MLPCNTDRQLKRLLNCLYCVEAGLLLLALMATL